MRSIGMKASELIKTLENAIATHGDLEVFSGGQDYPEGVRGVSYERKGTSYVPKNSFYVW